MNDELDEFFFLYCCINISNNAPKTWHATSQANNNDNHNPLCIVCHWTMLKIARRSCCEFGSVNIYEWQSDWTSFALNVSFAVPKLAYLYVISEYFQYLSDILISNFEYYVQVNLLDFYFVILIREFTAKWVPSRALKTLSSVQGLEWELLHFWSIKRAKAYARHFIDLRKTGFCTIM